MTGNGDTRHEFKVGGTKVCGLGSFHKTLQHDRFGEVNSTQFMQLVDATEGLAPFSTVPRYSDDTARLTNPQAGLAADRLTNHPSEYQMPPAPRVLSATTAAEMTELYWMALLRDLSFIDLADDPLAASAATEISDCFETAFKETKEPGRFRLGVDVPGSAESWTRFTANTVFRMGLPGEEVGPMLSQFFMRDASFGTQTISQRQRPYKSESDFLTTFDKWLSVQNSGKDMDGLSYPQSNEFSAGNYEDVAATRYIGTMRDLARFVNKDALHQAYFNAALLLLSGGARWNQGNPYGDFPTAGFGNREAGFGTLGGPHILALVSEVATRGLKVVWNQKWQVHLRLRPEAYGGLVHVQCAGVGAKKDKRAYGLPAWVAKTEAAKKVHSACGGYLLPMAFTAGSPTHPAYGAGHATVAGACVTILKAYFQTYDVMKDGRVVPKPLVGDGGLVERPEPFLPAVPFTAYNTGKGLDEREVRIPLDPQVAKKLTIEGELNKLASNVAMGRGMGGVHWRTDNTRSLILGEAMAAHVLADITTDLAEKPRFEFRSFSRDDQGQPKRISIQQGQIRVNGDVVSAHTSEL